MLNDYAVNKLTVIKVALLFLMVGFILKAGAVVGFDINWDTNYYLNIASYFIEEGELTPYMWRLGADTTIITGGGSGYGVLILTYWLQFFGLSLISGYILMYIIGLLSLIVLFYLARDWWNGDVAGYIAVTFTAISGYFISIFYIRMDAPGIFAYLLVLWLHLYAVRRNRLWLHAATGVLAIFATEIHIQAVIYVGAISFYYLVEQIKHWRNGGRLFSITPSVVFYIAAFFAGLIYIAVHVLPDPQAYFIIARECPNCSPAGLLKELRRYMLFCYTYGIEMLIFAIALTISYLRRTKEDNHLLVLLAGYVFTQTIVSPPAQVEYVTHMLPFLGLCVAGIFYHESNTEYAISRKQLIVVTVGSTVLVLKQLVIVAISVAIPGGEVAGITYVYDYVPTDTVIMGKPPIYHHLLDYPNFMSYDSGERYGIALRDEDYDTYYEREQAEVFIGMPDLNDESIWRYMNANNFQPVIDNIWVSETLLAEIISDNLPPDISFSTSATEIVFGDCVMLEWTVENADKVFLNQETVDSNGAREVCVLTGTNFRISVLWAGGMVSETLGIMVD